MKRFLFAVLAVGTLSLAGLGMQSAQAQQFGHRHGGYGYGGHHPGTQHIVPFHYDYYQHGNHFDAVPHVGGHGHSSYYQTRRPFYGSTPYYGNSYRQGAYGRNYGYGGRGGVNLPGISVRW